MTIRRITTLVRVPFIAAAVLMLPAPGFAQRTSVARDFPLYENAGKPDLVMDPQRFVVQDEGLNRYPNETEVRIHVPNPRKKVAIVQ